MKQNNFSAISQNKSASPRFIYELKKGSIWVNSFNPIQIHTARASISFQHAKGSYSYSKSLNHIILIKGYADLELKDAIGENLTAYTIPSGNQVKFTDSQLVEDYKLLEYSKLKKELKLKSGSYALLPQKQGMLKFAFEHALLLNILSFKNINAALSIIRQRTITRQAKEIYKEYIINLVQNLRILTINAPKIETKKAIFINAGNVKIPPSNWSDTASFCAVNELFSSNKMLFLGGLEKKTNMIKLSIRCTRNYLKNHDNLSVNNVITRIKEEFGGSGGGHKLAGGIRISVPSYKQLIKRIDEIL